MISSLMNQLNSTCVKYDTHYSHHVKEITIDLSNIIENQKILTITPRIIMNDSTGHNQSSKSMIEIVVIASIGIGNPNVYLRSSVDINRQINIPLNNINWIQSVLCQSSTNYNDRDHHLARFATHININRQANNYILRGASTIRDKGKNDGAGNVKGNIFAFDGNNHDVLFGKFDESILNANSRVDLGPTYGGFRANEYSFHCFVSSFQFSFQEGKDHHVKKIYLLSKRIRKRLRVENGRIYAQLGLKTMIRDKQYHCHTISHNRISGFVIAVKNIPPNNAL